MDDSYIVKMDGDPIRFTPEGSVYVLDAISAVSGTEDVRGIWKRMKEDHPDLLALCGTPTSARDDTSLVVDTQGWERIWMLLPDYLPHG